MVIEVREAPVPVSYRFEDKNGNWSSHVHKFTKKDAKTLSTKNGVLAGLNTGAALFTLSNNHRIIVRAKK